METTSIRIWYALAFAGYIPNVPQSGQVRMAGNYP
ncbi:hypothetical protein ABH892_003376 [Paenibacillus sp. RC254]